MKVINIPVELIVARQKETGEDDRTATHTLRKEKENILRTFDKLRKNNPALFDNCIKEYSKAGEEALHTHRPNEKITDMDHAFLLAEIKRRMQNDKRKEDIISDMATKGVQYAPKTYWRNEETIRTQYQNALKKYNGNTEFKDRVDTMIRQLNSLETP